MGYSDGRKQVRRILKIIERLQKVQKSRGIRVRDLAEFYGVDITRIYEDLKIIRDFYDLKKDRGSYWIESTGPLRWPRITSEERQASETQHSCWMPECCFPKFPGPALYDLYVKRAGHDTFANYLNSG